MEVRAVAKGVRISPSKVRPVVDLVRGKPAEEALVILRFTPKKAARVVAKVVRSAMANAENNFQIDPVNLRVARISADPGPMLKRYYPKARGRISPVLRRSCHITVVLEEVGGGT